jgi:hypothetical protein
MKAASLNWKFYGTRLHDNLRASRLKLKQPSNRNRNRAAQSESDQVLDRKYKQSKMTQTEREPSFKGWEHFASRSAFGFFCGAAFGLGVDILLSQQSIIRDRDGMGSMLEPRGLEKPYAGIISRNECGFSHWKKGLSSHN